MVLVLGEETLTIVLAQGPVHAAGRCNLLDAEQVANATS
jgi:hypothetical protein